MDMFRLVQDVPAYPEFLTWCKKAEVHEQSAEHQLATLKVRVSGVSQSFTTRNRFTPGGSGDGQMIVRRGVIGGHSDELDTADQEFCEELLLRREFDVKPIIHLSEASLV